MKTQFSILGAGWLGLPLSKVLCQEGHTIKGSTTTEQKLDVLAQHHIDPYRIELTEDGPKGSIDTFLNGSSILILNIPPGLRRNPEVNFVAKIEKLIPYIVQSTIEKVLFISSTSVFADQEGFPTITMNTQPNATSNTGKQLIATEQLLQHNPNFKTTILRFAGLYDERRHPATMLSKRKGIQNPNAPVNLIHLEDCLGIIQNIIIAEHWNSTFNAASPNHPSKVAYYTKVCAQMGLSAPDYNHEIPSKGKTIDATALIHQLEYTFIHSV